tara:strand:+ start:458 stop:757 length:300 start_codon:yes stop_codon:yes gene_type:complete
MKEITKFEGQIIVTNMETVITERRILLIQNRTFDWIKNLRGFNKFSDIEEFFKYYKSVDKLVRELNENYNLSFAFGDKNREYYISSYWVYGRVYAFTKK